MKGVVLAGGLGTRLYPLTEVTNKHLLPVGYQPMIYYPLQMMARSGITEVIVVVGGKSTEAILRLLQDGRKFGFKRLYYAFQEGEGGIAAALNLADSFAKGEDICVMLGDNLFLGEGVGHLIEDAKRQLTHPTKPHSAHIVLVKVTEPKHYGCPLFNDAGELERIIEKPAIPEGPWIVSGLYFYNGSVFEAIRQLSPSDRGELEITDLNNIYLEAKRMSYSYFGGMWLDAGESIEGLLEASQRVVNFNEVEEVI